MNKKDLDQINKDSKVTQLLEDINLNLIQDIRLDKEENTADIEKIKSKAMQHAKASLENQKPETINVINMKEKRGKQRSIRRSVLIPLVAILGLIGVAIASAGSNSILSNLFGELFPYHDQVQAVGTKQISNGIIFTVEGAFIDNKGGLFIVSMEKEDGSKFVQNDYVGRIRLDMKKPSSKGWGAQPYLMEDNKKLVTIMDLSSNKNLYNQKLTFSAENIVNWVEDKEVIALDLNQMYQNYQFEVLRGNEETWYNYERKNGLNLHLVQSMEELSIDDVRLTDKGLSILTSYKEPEVAVDGTLVRLALVDTRTGSIYDGESHTNWDGEEQVTKNAFVFKHITADDLPYLQVRYEAAYDKMVVEGKWEVTIKLNKNSQVISKMILQPVKLTGKQVVFTHIEVSALGVRLKGYGETDNTTNLDVRVLMKDGEEVPVTSGGGSYNGTRLTVHYDLGTDEGSYIPNLIAIEDVVGVKINGKVIKMKQ